MADKFFNPATRNFSIQRFNSYIELQVPTMGKDSLGATEKTWATFANAWAFFVHDDSKEMGDGGAIKNYQRFIVYIRYFPGVTSQMRIIKDSVIYNILTVTNFNMTNKIYEIVCETGLNDG